MGDKINSVFDGINNYQWNLTKNCKNVYTVCVIIPQYHWYCVVLRYNSLPSVFLCILTYHQGRLLMLNNNIIAHWFWDGNKQTLSLHAFSVVRRPKISFGTSTLLWSRGATKMLLHAPTSVNSRFYSGVMMVEMDQTPCLKYQQ